METKLSRTIRDALDKQYSLKKIFNNEETWQLTMARQVLLQLPTMEEVGPFDYFINIGKALITWKRFCNRHPDVKKDSLKNYIDMIWKDSSSK